MKRQIRQSCFETNSSSTHAICIATEDILDIPKSIHFGFDDFGWSRNTYHDNTSKADYLYTALPYVAQNMDELQQYISFIYNTLKKHGVEEITMEDFKLDVYYWDKDISLAISSSGYIDHGSEISEFVNSVCSDENRLMHYLFSRRSYVETGNDNDDYDVDIKVDYPHEEFYKGN